MYSNWFRKLLRDIRSLGKNNQRIMPSRKIAGKQKDYAGLISVLAGKLNEIFSG